MEHHAFNWFQALPVPPHTSIGILVAILLVAFALRIRPRLVDVDGAIDPDDGVSARNLGEVFVEMIAGLAEGVIGSHSEKYVPLLASFFAYILVCNLIGLVPGFSPPTADFNVTFGLGVVSFLAYNAYGFKAQGPAYAKHFLGPLMAIAPLMLLIELFSHAFRPVSLGIRLFANLFADHQVVEIFTELTKLVVPVVFYVLGTFVGIVQSFVFTMLSAIYIALAVSHDH